MMHTPTTTSLGRAYNAFLFESIVDDGGSAPLTTVSLLARLDIDPWREAAELSRMPREAAIQRMTALLLRLPGRHDGLADPETIAGALVALLPGRTTERAAVTSRAANADAALNTTFVAIGFGFAVIVLLSGFLRATNDETATQPSARNDVVSSASPVPMETPDRRSSASGAR